MLQGTKVGDSIAVNGICLTVTSMTGDSFTADIMPETLHRSSLGKVTYGNCIVNLERAMLAGGRFGGHIISGHIDGVGTIMQIREDGNAVWYQVKAESGILRYVIEKGSIAIDGISLTVADVYADGFMVSVIPHTRSVTSLSQKKVGDIVNLENDCIGKYVERLLDFSDLRKDTSGSVGITKELLGKYGF